MSRFELNELELIQERMRNQVVIKDGFEKLDYFCGCDVSYGIDDDAIVAFVTLDNDFNIVEKKKFYDKATFPYIPAFLSFREGPLIINNYTRLKVTPDVLFIDGHGIAHPRRLGLASYVGVKLHLPTIGIAKKNLCSEIPSLPVNPSEKSPMYMDGLEVGHVMKTEKGSNCIYVSPGNLISVPSSIMVVERMLKGHKLPEPSRLAHELTRDAKN
ncbi:MAG: endonuclease V [Candidatus Hodarchaeota archaeon]